MPWNTGECSRAEHESQRSRNLGEDNFLECRVAGREDKHARSQGQGTSGNAGGRNVRTNTRGTKAKEPWGMQQGGTRGPTRDQPRLRNLWECREAEREDQHARTQGQGTSGNAGGGTRGPRREETRPRNLGICSVAECRDQHARNQGQGTSRNASGRNAMTNTRGTKAKEHRAVYRRGGTRGPTHEEPRPRNLGE